MAETEQTLHVARLVQLYRIPPRGPTGHVSGEWRQADKRRLRIVTVGEECEVRFEDTSSSTGELFACAPIPFGKRTTYIETVVDSSRNFVVRVEDSVSKQHAFLGMSFSERSDSFDFNEALLRHEKHVERERASRTLAAAAGGSSPAAAGTSAPASAALTSTAMQDVKSLYANHDDYNLKEGQTIRVNLQKKTPKPGGLMSSRPGGFPSLAVPLPPPTAAPSGISLGTQNVTAPPSQAKAAPPRGAEVGF